MMKLTTPAMVQVGGVVTRHRIARHQPAAVDEDEGAVRAEAAQVHRGRAVGAVRDVRSLSGECLRQLVDDVLDAHLAGLGDVLAADRGDRADALEIRRDDAGTRNDELFGLAFTLLRNRSCDVQACRQRAHEERVLDGSTQSCVLCLCHE
jgi:hypothetical protein